MVIEINRENEVEHVENSQKNQINCIFRRVKWIDVENLRPFRNGLYIYT